MPILSAENHFKKGLSALVDHNYKDAIVFFRRALDIDKERGRRHPDLRYLSYYGLSMAKAGMSTNVAIKVCRSAVARQTSHPVLLLNLGRVYMIARKPRLAREAFDRGARVAPANRVLTRELASLERRSKPVLAMLPRNHPVNRALGKIRHSLLGSRKSSHGAAQAMPASRS